jgi:hypothetical protein
MDKSFRFGPGRLREHSLDAIAEAMEKALSALTGQTLDVRISRIEFDDPMDGIATFSLTVSYVSQSDLFDRAGHKPA